MLNTTILQFVRTFFQFRMLFILVLLNSCADLPPPGPEDEIDQRKFGVHMVQFDKESPSLISAWYTDSPKNWVKFFVLKRQNSSGPYLPLGAKVYIPTELLKKQTPLTLEFMKNWRAENRIERVKVPKKGREIVPPKENEEQKSELTDVVDGDQLIENLIAQDTE